MGLARLYCSGTLRRGWREQSRNAPDAPELQKALKWLLFKAFRKAFRVCFGLCFLPISSDARNEEDIIVSRVENGDWTVVAILWREWREQPRNAPDAPELPKAFKITDSNVPIGGNGVSSCFLSL